VSKYRNRLTSAESGMFDLMFKTSKLLEDLKDESLEDVRLALLEGDAHAEQIKKARAIQHDVVTYAFTLGVQFAVNRRQEVARQVAKQLGLVRDTDA